MSRFFNPYGSVLVLGYVVASCALPSETEAGKTRCHSDADCPSPLVCANEQCSDVVSMPDAGTSTPDAGPMAVKSCPNETTCSGTETCYHGLCSTSGATCEEGNVPDGCPDDAVCISFGEETSTCRRFPACGPDIPCPRSPFGSVCSTNIRPDKVSMCLPMLCETEANCPDGAQCLDFGPYRACSDGSSGAPCRMNTDCDSGECFTLISTCR